MNATALNIGTQDRKDGSKPPNGFRVLEARRVENSKLWERFAKQRGKILQYLTEPMDTSNIKSMGIVQLSRAGFSLHDNVGEAYLFHATKKESVDLITEGGFRIDLAGTATFAAFGKGSYFAECSTKSDEYAVADENGFYHMLLCRVILGREYRILDFDSKAERHVCNSDGRYHSLLGDREAAKHTFREFIVYESEQIYPEYTITYQRRYD
jgi:hypothetical protein